MDTIQLAIIEDDFVTRENLKIYLTAHPSIKLAIEADSVESFLRQLQAMVRPEIDLMLLDIGLPGMTGLDGIPQIKALMPDMAIVMLTTYEEDDVIFDALCAGACAYIAKRTPLSKIRDAVFIVYRGGSYMSPSIAKKVVAHFMPKKVRAPKTVLTPRQKEIVEALVDGLSYQKIAKKLDISIDTVRDHIRRIYRLLDVNSKMEVVRKSLDGEI